jgi:glycosyltransferase involved in cell wall biosynthesis
LKIAHVAQTVDLITPDFAGGRGRFIYNLATKQAEKGHDVSIIAAPGSSIPKCNVVSISLKPRSNDWFPINLCKRRFAEFSHVIRSLRWVNSGFDIVHNHVEWEGAALSRMFEHPLITTIHGWLNQKISGRIYSKLCDLPSTSAYVTYTKTAYDSLKPLYSKRLLGHIYPSIDTKFFRFNEHLDTDTIRICCVGRLAPEKGFHTAIKLADNIHRHNRPVNLRLLGAVDNINKNYPRLILREAQKRRYVSLTVNASLNEVVRTFQNSHVTLMPIEWEELFGFVAAESLACGTPVVAYNRGALREIISHQETGYLCGTFKELYKGCLFAMEINRKICRQKIEQKFSREATYRKYVEIYHDIIN